MIVSLVEIGVWASWTATKYLGAAMWSAISLGVWGHAPSEEERFKAQLLKRIGDLEHSNEDLTAAILARGGRKKEVMSEFQGSPAVSQKITYLPSPIPSSGEDDQRPPPPTAPASGIMLPAAPSDPVVLGEAKVKPVATAL
tara:strand:- start:152 stop:574 length:423 start_codon:yes stop_codon:yes gene_type:complete